MYAWKNLSLYSQNVAYITHWGKKTNKNNMTRQSMNPAGHLQMKIRSRKSKQKKRGEKSALVTLVFVTVSLYSSFTRMCRWLVSTNIFFHWSAVKKKGEKSFHIFRGLSLVLRICNAFLLLLISRQNHVTMHDTACFMHSQGICIVDSD